MKFETLRFDAIADMEFVNALVPANNLAIPFVTFVLNAVVNSRIFPERKLNAEDIGTDSVLPSNPNLVVIGDEEIALLRNLEKLSKLDIAGMERIDSESSFATPNMLSAALEIACVIVENLKVARSLGMFVKAVSAFCIDLKVSVMREKAGNCRKLPTACLRPPYPDCLLSAMPTGDVTFRE